MVPRTAIALGICLATMPLAQAQAYGARAECCARCEGPLLLERRKGLQKNGFEPLSTEQPMQTVDGQSFAAQMSCRATQQFLRVTMFPTGQSDIGHFTVETDRDMNGSLESNLAHFQGPFAGVLQQRGDRLRSRYVRELPDTCAFRKQADD